MARTGLVCISLKNVIAAIGERPSVVYFLHRHIKLIIITMGRCCFFPPFCSAGFLYSSCIKWTRYRMTVALRCAVLPCLASIALDDGRRRFFVEARSPPAILPNDFRIRFVFIQKIQQEHDPRTPSDLQHAAHVLPKTAWGDLSPEGECKNCQGREEFSASTAYI